MKEQKFFGTILVIAFFACVSMAWRASWQNARTTPPLIDRAGQDELAFTAKLNAKPLFEPPKAPKKQAAPAWGSFRVAGVAPAGQPVSLKHDFTGAKQNKINADAAKKKTDAEKEKKKKELAKKKAEEKKSVATAAKPKTAPSKSADEKMKPIEDKGSGNAVAIIAGAPAALPPAQDPAKKPANGRNAQEWELYLLSNTSLTKARTQEFISAYQTGQLVNEEEAGSTLTWIYPLIQKMYDHSELIVQESALRISKEVVTSESFALVVKNSNLVDHSLRPKLTNEYRSYRDLKRVHVMSRAMFHADRVVQNQALTIANESVLTYLVVDQTQQPAVNQRSQSSTRDPYDVFEPFIKPVERLIGEEKDSEVLVNANTLLSNLKSRLTSSTPTGQFTNNFQNPPN